MPPIPLLVGRFEMRAAEATPMSPGEIEITAAVEVTYAIQPEGPPSPHRRRYGFGGTPTDDSRLRRKVHMVGFPTKSSTACFPIRRGRGRGGGKHMSPTNGSRLAAGLAIALLQACGGQQGSDEQAEALWAQGQSPKKLDPEVLCAPNRTDFTLMSLNPWFPIGPVCQQWVLEGEEDDEIIYMEITVLDATEEVAGVTTRVIEEAEWIGGGPGVGELAEVSLNFFVGTAEGTVCYFGEDVDIFEDGQVSHEGAWRADEPGNHPGIIMPADPAPGMKFLTEGAPGVAQDVFKIIGHGPPVEVPFGEFGNENLVRVEESNPLNGDKGYKVFAGGEMVGGQTVGGIIVDEVLELTDFRLVGADRCAGLEVNGP
jgi:hypothetical protein